MVSAAEGKVTKCVQENDKTCLLPEGSSGKQLYYLSELIDEGLIDNMKSPESHEMCESDISYVEVKSDGRSSYSYTACLYCGEYQSV